MALRSLQANYAYTDSCRLLVILALNDDIFSGFSNWEELLSVKRQDTAVPLLIKDEMKDRPVMHYLHRGKVRYREHASFAQNTSTMAKMMSFERVSLYAFRRMALQAVMGDPAVSTSTSRTFAGHLRSDTYERYYAPRIPLADIQACFRRLPPQPDIIRIANGIEVQRTQRSSEAEASIKQPEETQSGDIAYCEGEEDSETEDEEQYQNAPIGKLGQTSPHIFRNEISSQLTNTSLENENAMMIKCVDFVLNQK